MSCRYYLPQSLVSSAELEAPECGEEDSSADLDFAAQMRAAEVRLGCCLEAAAPKVV